MRPIILPTRVETHYAVITKENPKCPTCGEEIIGKIKYSTSGHWCCTACFSTKFNNR